MLKLLYFTPILVFLTIIGMTPIALADESQFVIEQSHLQNEMRSPVSITLTADKGSNILNLTGNSISTSDIEFKVVFPSGKKIVSQDLLSPDDKGNFTIEFKIDDTWIEDGFYRIMIMQTMSQNELLDSYLDVKIIDGLISESTLSTISKVVKSKLVIPPITLSESSIVLITWENMRGELVKIFPTSIDKLLERGYLTLNNLK